MPGMVGANITIPEILHDKMKAIRLARYRMEKADVTLSRMYIEAIELYLKAAPQQELLKEVALSLSEESEPRRTEGVAYQSIGANH